MVKNCFQVVHFGRKESFQAQNNVTKLSIIKRVAAWRRYYRVGKDLSSNSNKNLWGIKKNLHQFLTWTSFAEMFVTFRFQIFTIVVVHTYEDQHDVRTTALVKIWYPKVTIISERFTKNVHQFLPERVSPKIFVIFRFQIFTFVVIKWRFCYRIILSEGNTAAWSFPDDRERIAIHHFILFSLHVWSSPWLMKREGKVRT